MKRKDDQDGKNKMKIIAICQIKGGTSKSTAVLNLAAALAEHGQKVLVVDADEQRTITTTILPVLQAGKDLDSLILDPRVKLTSIAKGTEWDGVDIISGSHNLPFIASELVEYKEKHFCLQKKLIAAEYDFCIIDTSSSLNIVTINAMCAAHGIFIPLTSNYLSFGGLAKTLDAYEYVCKNLNHELQLFGAGFLIHDKMSRFSKEIEQNVNEQYPGMLFETKIGKNIKIEEAQVQKQSILTYAPGDIGAVQYRALAEELKVRMGS